MSGDVLYHLRELQQKNVELQAALNRRELEVEELREVAEAAAELQAQDVQAAKIIELSKKNRQLLLALEREKTKVAKLQSESNSSSSNARPTSPAALDPEAVEDIARSMVEQAAEAADAAAKEAALWKERHQQQTNKISQLEQKAFTLEIEVKKLQRALQREVGDEVPLAKILDESTDWKGRREQIIALKDQIKQLKAAQGYVVDSRQEAAAKKAISKISHQRVQDTDRMAVDLATAKLELESLKLKYDGAISRRKILEAEIANMKDKVAVVLEKTNNDDRLIAALKAELAVAKKGVVQEQGPTGSEDDVWRELGQCKRKVKELEAQVERQEQIIMALQQQLTAQRVSTPPHSRDGSLEQQLRLAEVENSRLQELVQLMQTKLQDR